MLTSYYLFDIVGAEFQIVFFLQLLLQHIQSKSTQNPWNNTHEWTTRLSTFTVTGQETFRSSDGIRTHNQVLMKFVMQQYQ